MKKSIHRYPIFSPVRSACGSACPDACSSHDGCRPASRLSSRTRWPRSWSAATCSNLSTSFYASRCYATSTASGSPRTSRRRCCSRRGTARGPFPFLQPRSASSSPIWKCAAATPFAYAKGHDLRRNRTSSRCCQNVKHASLIFFVCSSSPTVAENM